MESCFSPRCAVFSDRELSTAGSICLERGFGVSKATLVGNPMEIRRKFLSIRWQSGKLAMRRQGSKSDARFTRCTSTLAGRRLPFHSINKSTSDTGHPLWPRRPCLLGVHRWQPRLLELYPMGWKMRGRGHGEGAKEGRPAGRTGRPRR